MGTVRLGQGRGGGPRTGCGPSCKSSASGLPSRYRTRTQSEILSESLSHQAPLRTTLEGPESGRLTSGGDLHGRACEGGRGFPFTSWRRRRSGWMTKSPWSVMARAGTASPRIWRATRRARLARSRTDPAVPCRERRVGQAASRNGTAPRARPEIARELRSSTLKSGTPRRNLGEARHSRRPPYQAESGRGLLRANLPGHVLPRSGRPAISGAGTHP